MLHFHISNVLPAEVYSTGVVRPFPVSVGPAAVASAVTSEWLPAIIGGQRGPAVRQEPQPEEVARMANRLADAMAAGMEPPRWIDRQLVKAAKLIMKGRSFTIKSAGRAIQVRAAAPASWKGIRRDDPALQGAQPGVAALRRSSAPSSWRGIRNSQPSAAIQGGQPGAIARRAR